MMRVSLTLLLSLLALFSGLCTAHHILGRPAYSLNEDSNTPSSIQVETQIGDYFINYMVYPAFPKAREPGRINLYASHIDNGEPFEGTVRFFARDDTWFSEHQDELGMQQSDDNVYRQGFMFQQDGEYIIRAEFEANGEPYLIDFPLRVGQPSALGPISISALALLLVLVGANVVQRKRLQREKISSAHAEVQSRTNKKGDTR